MLHITFRKVDHIFLFDCLIAVLHDLEIALTACKVKISKMGSSNFYFFFTSYRQKYWTFNDVIFVTCVLSIIDESLILYFYYGSWYNFGHKGLKVITHASYTCRLYTLGTLCRSQSPHLSTTSLCRVEYSDWIVGTGKPHFPIPPINLRGKRPGYIQRLYVLLIYDKNSYACYLGIYDIYHRTNLFPKTTPDNLIRSFIHGVVRRGRS